MHQQCSFCNLKYEREPGYFIGAMYIAYAISLPVGGVLIAAIWLTTHWDFARCAGLAFLIYLPVVPFIVRYSRVLWLHWDRGIDP